MSSTNDIQVLPSAIRVYPLRLTPNMDVFASIRTVMKKANLRSVFIMTCVGSVKRGRLRMANTTNTVDLEKPHEIVSLVGTFDGELEHIHGSFSDETGRVIGGHVFVNHPMIVYTTVEIVLGECENVLFTREMDKETGYPELVINKI